MQPNAPSLWLPHFPWPKADGHKYARGHLAVVGGQAGTLGAATLAAKAAQRLTCGMVSILCHGNTQFYYALAGHSLLTQRMDDPAPLRGWIKERRVTALVIGPGQGQYPQARDWTLACLSADIPLVLDADSLTLFEASPETLFNAIKARNAPTVLTPHEGEFIRLFGEFDSREEAVRKAADLSGAVIVLKGPKTLIASTPHPGRTQSDPGTPRGNREIPDNADAFPGNVVVQESASPWLATAGSGDVLAGMIGSLLASRMDATPAAACAVWLHAEAARLLGPGVIAEDLATVLPNVLESL